MPNAATESLISAEQLHLLGSKGQVPMRRRRQLVRRRRLQDQLCQAIRELAKNPEADWLLVHGMPGVGKTQLVADVLWEKPELCFATFGRIFWLKHCSPLPQFVSDSVNIISMGQSAVSSWRMECFLAGEENPDAAGEEKGADQADASGCSAAGRGKFPQIQLMGQQLKAVLEDSMADTLLVLDGVTSAETVHFFNQYKAKNCKLLATSTSQDIFCPLDDCQLQHFHLGTDELSANELAQLAACHGIEFADNERLLSVLARSGGNLAFLEKLFTMARGRKDIFLSLLAKFHSGLCPLPEFGCHSAYFFQSLDIPLHNCLKMIDPGIGHSFAHCSVMERHVWTPFHILSLAWPQDVTGHENEAQLRALVDQQLSTVARNSLLDQRTANDGSHFQYRLHPITHSFLLHSLPDSNAIFQHSCHSFLVKLRRHFLTAEYLNQNEHRLLDLGRRLAGNNGSRNGRRHWNGRLENSVANGAEDNAAGGSTISQSILRFFSSMW